jgi:hypothetical protein
MAYESARIDEVLGCATIGWREMNGCTTGQAHEIHDRQANGSEQLQGRVKEAVAIVYGKVRFRGETASVLREGKGYCL